MRKSKCLKNAGASLVIRSDGLKQIRDRDHSMDLGMEVERIDYD